MLEFLRGYQGNILDWLPEFFVASLRTLELMVLAFLLATVLGIVIALARISKARVLRGSAILYIECLRARRCW